MKGEPGEGETEGRQRRRLRPTKQRPWLTTDKGSWRFERKTAKGGGGEKTLE